MARPQKATVDYFPHYVASGKTMYTLEAKWGNDGYAFWFKLLETLGQSEQHFIDCENVADWQFLLAKTRVSEVIANEILDMLAKLDAIDRDLWQFRIIRSNNFIRNLVVLYSRRTVHIISNDEVKKSCLQKRNTILDDTTTKEELLHTETPLNGVIAYINPSQDNNCMVSANINPQRKGKKSIEKNRIYNTSDFADKNVQDEGSSENIKDESFIDDTPFTISNEVKKSSLDTMSGPDKQSIKPISKKEYSDQFLSFYDQYPRKEEKQQAYRAYNARIKEGAKHEDIMRALEIYLREIEILHTDYQYIKLPSTFINNFNDYLDPNRRIRPTNNKEHLPVYDRGMLDLDEP